MISFLSFLTVIPFLPIVAAQTFAFNGQVFTRGLAIIDSPAPQSILHAGSTVAIAIDISGDGNLPMSASSPDSGDATHFDSLEIYFVSYPQSINLTVSSGAGLLAQESGSTVKHINHNISSCVPAGQYNLSFYEVSHIENQQYFVISDIPVEIQNTNQEGTCNITNALDGSPQIDNAPSQSPWLKSTAGATTITPNLPSATGSGALSLWDLTVVQAVGIIAGLVSILYTSLAW